MSQTECSFDVIEEIVDDTPETISNQTTTATNAKLPSSSSKKSTTKSTVLNLDHGPSTSRVNLYSIERSDSSISSNDAGFANFDLTANSGNTNILTPEIEQLQDVDGGSAHPPMASTRLSGQQIASVTPTASQASNIDYLLTLLPPNVVTEMPFDDSIVIRGNGNMTLFGLSNSFSNTFPSALLGRVSKEEFEYTINRINHLLQQQHSTNAKFLILGCLCCCCSLGCSLLWPTFALSKRTRSSLEKVRNLTS